MNFVINRILILSEIPWPFLLSTASLFLIFDAVLLDTEFSLCSSTFFLKNIKDEKYSAVSYIYDEDTMKTIFSFENKIKGIKQAKSFLSILHHKIVKLKNYELNEISENKVVFYDIFLKNYFVFDSKEFNNLLYTTYVNDFFLLLIVKDNKLYNYISFFLSLIHSKYNYVFLNPSISLFDIKSFFFKNLRFIASVNSFFSEKLFFDNLKKTVKLFNQDVTDNKYQEFFEELLLCLESNNIILYDMIRENFKFCDDISDDSLVLLNRSFQSFSFGYDKFSFNFENKFYISLESIMEFVNHYESFCIETKHKTDDFIFFFILSSCTNSLNCAMFINNTFFEDLYFYKNESSKIK